MNTDKVIAENIASQYAPKKTSKIVALKKLDRKAKLGAEIFGYSFGIIFSLIIGVILVIISVFVVKNKINNRKVISDGNNAEGIWWV